jgi:outer membrane lipoprotein
MKFSLLILSLSVLLIAGCTAPTVREDRGPTPAEVVASGQDRLLVHWGGQIVKVKNLSDRTLIEVLALPLDNKGRPLTDKPAEGRFIVDKPGFLEPHDYAPNRLLEVRGHLNGFTPGKVGDVAYRYPVVIGATLALWPETRKPSGYRMQRPRVNVGIGGGSGGGRVGVGIGF